MRAADDQAAMQELTDIIPECTSSVNMGLVFVNLDSPQAAGFGHCHVLIRALNALMHCEFRRAEDYPDLWTSQSIFQER